MLLQRWSLPNRERCVAATVESAQQGEVCCCNGGVCPTGRGVLLQRWSLPNRERCVAATVESAQQGEVCCCNGGVCQVCCCNGGVWAIFNSFSSSEDDYFDLSDPETITESTYYEEKSPTTPRYSAFT